MKFKNKGRKIYKTKEKNYYGKSPVGKAFSIGLTVLLIGGIGFLGYSVAEPLINYSNKKGDKTDSSAIELPDETPTNQDGEPLTGGDANNIAPPINTEDYCAYTLSPMDISSPEAIKTALRRVPADEKIKYIEVPLKASGGNIYYDSTNYFAKQAGAVQSSVKLTDIVNAISSEGYKPVAMMSTFSDSIVPDAFRDMGYYTLDDGSQWIDNALEAGGKPWMTPFSDRAVTYNSDIAAEISSAGFEKVVCSDFIFPTFRESDIEYLGESVISSDRYMVLTSAANLLYDRIMENGANMMLEVSASELLKGNNDIVQPMLLKVNTVILNIDLDTLSYGVYTADTVYEFSGTPAENVKKMLDLVGEDVDDFNVVVRISGMTLSTQDLLDAKDEIVGCGYSSFVLG